MGILGAEKTSSEVALDSASDSTEDVAGDKCISIDPNVNFSADFRRVLVGLLRADLGRFAVDVERRALDIDLLRRL